MGDIRPHLKRPPSLLRPKRAAVGEEEAASPLEETLSSIRSKLQRPSLAQKLVPDREVLPAPGAKPSSKPLDFTRAHPSRILCNGSVSRFNDAPSESSRVSEVEPSASQLNLHKSDQTDMTSCIDDRHAFAIFGKRAREPAIDRSAEQLQSSRHAKGLILKDNPDESLQESSNADGLRPIWTTLSVGDACVVRREGRSVFCTILGVTHQGYPNARYRVQMDADNSSFEVGVEQACPILFMNRLVAHPHIGAQLGLKRSLHIGCIAHRHN